MDNWAPERVCVKVKGAANQQHHHHHHNQNSECVPNQMMRPGSTNGNGNECIINNGQTPSPLRRNRRATNESNRSSGKSYSEIREAYNIPSNNTLPPGIMTRNNSDNSRPRSEEGKDFIQEMQARDQRSGDGYTVNTGMSTRHMGNTTNNNNSRTMPRRRSKSFSGMMIPLEEHSMDVSKIINQPPPQTKGPVANKVAGYASDGCGVVKRVKHRRASAAQALGPSVVNSKSVAGPPKVVAGHASDGGGVNKRQRLRPSPAGSSQPPNPTRQQNNNGSKPVTNTKQIASTTTNNGQYVRKKSVDSGYASDIPARTRNRPGLGTRQRSVPVVQSDSLAPNDFNKKYKKRHSFDGAPRPQSGRIRAMAKMGSNRNIGSGNVSSGSDPGGGNDIGGHPPPSGNFGGLKPLPEDASYSGSGCFNDKMLSQLKEKDLNSMTLEELKTELKKQRVAVEGAFERKDLVNICAQKRKQRNKKNKAHPQSSGAAPVGITSYPNKCPSIEHNNSIKSVPSAKSSAKSGTSLINSGRQPIKQTLASRIKRDSFSAGRGPGVQGNSMDRASVSAPPADGERGGNNGNAHLYVPLGRPRSRTHDELDGDSTVHFSANPQQGIGMSPFNVSTTINNISTTNNNSTFRNAVAPLTQHNSAKSNISSMGDPGELNGMAVVNAPLGVGLSGLGQDVQNPNQQMGQLLQQMQQLEVQMVPPGEDQRFERKNSNQSGRSARSSANRRPTAESGGGPSNPSSRRSTGSGIASGSGNPMSRRLSAPSDQSELSGGGGPGSNFANPMSRRLSAASDQSGLSGGGGPGSNFANPMSRRLSLESGCDGDGGFANPSTRHLSAASGQSGLSGPSSFHSGPPSNQGSLRDFNHSNRGLNDGGKATPQKLPTLSTAGSAQGSALWETGSNMAQISADKTSTKNKCRPCSKKLFCIVVFLLLILGGAMAGALLLFVFKIGEKNTDVEKAPASRDSVVEVAGSTSPAPSPAKYLEVPPLDIEGRCSPSNLPGSLSACFTACMPSACCYPNQEEADPCINDTDRRSVDACNRYRPYCDVFYDSWLGSEQGELRNPPATIVTMCMIHVEEISNTTASIEASDEEERPSPSVEKKRLRAHATKTNGELREHHRKQQSISQQHYQSDIYQSNHGSRRNLWVPTPNKICEEHCKSARCCHAPTYVMDTVVSASGVYTNSTSDEYVMTNCQQQIGKNKELCKEYDKFCDIPSSAIVDNGSSYNRTYNDGTSTNMTLANRTAPMSIEPSSSPSTIPTYNLFLQVFISPTASPTLSSKPSNTPSISSPPTTSIPPSLFKIPPSSTLDIAAVCSGTENEAMISGEVVSAREKCLGACQNGLCCYAEMLGHGSSMPPCFEGNEGRCLGYLPCLVLAEESIDILEGIKTNSTVSFTIEGLPLTLPAQNLTELCSQDSIFTLAGLMECISACEAGSCCDAIEAELSCRAENPTTCLLYQPCTRLVPRANTPTAAKNPNLPPPAPEELSTMCSYESLAISGEDCYKVCQPGACCSGGSCLKEDGNELIENLDDLNGICEKYQPCQNLLLVSAPQNDIDEICDRRNIFTDECATICYVVSCCFLEPTGYARKISSSRSNPIDAATRTEVCPHAYNHSIASSYEAGSEVEFDRVIYRCNDEPWTFYCTQINFGPHGINDMWVGTWSVVGPCISLPTESMSSATTPNPTSPSMATQTYFPATESNGSTISTVITPLSSCYALFEETCNAYAPYCAPNNYTP